eukprot:scaffold253263_cov30-Tisochrysis_lutea.AAC.3
MKRSWPRRATMKPRLNWPSTCIVRKASFGNTRRSSPSMVPSSTRVARSRLFVLGTVAGDSCSRALAA